MNRIRAVGIIFFSSLSLGLNEECCLRKQVGEFSYNYIASEDTSSHSCRSDCVYSRERDPDTGNRYCFATGKLKSECQDSSDALRATHAFYSGLSSFHSKLKSSLTKEQVPLVSHPAQCSKPACSPPDYCWHGKCVENDDPKVPPGSYIVYINSIKAHTKLLKNLMPKVFKALSDACSPTRIECYGECLPKLLDGLAECKSLYLWNVPKCVKKVIENIEKDCSACVCDLVFLIIPDIIFKNFIQDRHHLCIPIPKPVYTEPTDSCDRDCATPGPKTCVFNFKLESVKTDADGRRADGRLRSVLAYNGQLPGPPIVICEGDTLVVNFENNISGNMTNADGSTNTTTLHFHGIREKSRPWSDGVPFVSQCPILPGDPSWKTNQYGFNTDVDGAPPGTYWYHSHVGAQRTNGAYGALIIKENGSNPSYPDIDVDDASNTLVLQEWYESATHQMPVSILINGNGRVGEEKNSGGDDEILSFLHGKGGEFLLVPNEDHTRNFTTNYTEFNVEKGISYRFRIIGAISQNFPLQVSIEDHTFTAIAADSLNIQPVENLTNVWLAAGERYDIVIQSKTSVKDQAYKIKVLGYGDIYEKKSPVCTIAWLRYPGQTIDYNYVTPGNCSDFDHFSSGRTLNPVPNNYEEWIHSPGNGKIFIKDIKSIKNESTIDFDHLANLNTHYIEFAGNITFNNKRMKYPRTPFLLQDPEVMTGRCGSKCDAHVGSLNGGLPYLYTTCTELEFPATSASEEDYCKCQHVIQQPWAPGYWAETVLINNLPLAAAHPIHQHGGWYWVVGMGKYNQTKYKNISRNFIMEEDKKGNLNRSFSYAPAKDTLQIPPNGYAIIRTKLDNAGAWIFHCHINFHVEIGMAMVLQIGELGKDQLEGQNWCTGSLKKNSPCKTPPPPPGGGPAFIHWFFGMEPATRCVKPGTAVTWQWEKDEHNVNMITEDEYNKCNVSNTTPHMGDFVWTAPEIQNTTVFYFACGMYKGNPGYHCKHGGMKAMVKVSVHCPI